MHITPTPPTQEALKEAPSTPSQPSSATQSSSQIQHANTGRKSFPLMVILNENKHKVNDVSHLTIKRRAVILRQLLQHKISQPIAAHMVTSKAKFAIPIHLQSQWETNRPRTMSPTPHL